LSNSPNPFLHWLFFEIGSHFMTRLAYTVIIVYLCFST
jgi:hypothetical protein